MKSRFYAALLKVEIVHSSD